MRTVRGNTDHVVVVGAGLSGLSAAMQLAGQGRSVTVVERYGFPGGRVGQEVDSYYLLGANLRVDDLLGTGCYFNLRGSNILDEEYRYPTYVNNTWADRGTLGEPLMILATLGLKF